MTLTLVIGSGARLANGAPGELVLHRRGAVVGRAATCDWPLPDPTLHVSSRHFEVRYDGRDYTIVDRSTNGTVLASTGVRLTGAHVVRDGERFQVGPFVIEARLSGESRRDAPPAAETPPAWRGWDTDPTPPADGPDQAGGGWGADTGSGSGWAPSPAAGGGDSWAPLPPSDPVRRAPPAGGGNAGWQPQVGPSLGRPEPHRVADASYRADGYRDTSPGGRSAGWAPDAAIAPPPVASAWEAASPAPDPASGWSSAAPDRPAALSPDDLWGRIADGNVVDWARGGFGQPVEPPRDPLGLHPAGSRESLPREAPRAPEPPPPPPPARSATPDPFLTGAGVDPSGIGDPSGVAAQAGALFRRMVAGLVVMLEARARAKAQLGAEATAYSPSGHNPLKFARSPDEAVAALLGPARAGFMPAEAALEDAYRELQQHQVATLHAMQGALRATLERFSPSAIRARADAGGVLERILPAARDAALWHAYEREFDGVALGSDEAFLDMFAKEFRRAYNHQADMREGGRR